VKRSAALGPGFLVVMLLGGCGSTPPTEKSEPSISLESFAPLTAQAVCTLAFQCCAANQRADLPQAEPECRAVLAADLEQELLPNIKAAVARGQLSYHPERYAGCLARAVSAGCDTARIYVDCLEEGFAPLVSAGGRCNAQAHCMEGACIGATSTKAGICGEPLADGLDCGIGLECANGACINGVCRARMSDGHSCYTDSECVSERCDGIAHVCAPPSRAMCD
jgi:hypothetical protein